ncbi:MAG: flagellar protein FliT [Pseudomonadota bacterium]|jgi:hypothetical protein
MGTLDDYQEALRLSEEMLACARESRWDDLVAAEQARAGVLDRLRELEGRPETDRVLRSHKREALARMLACDEEVSTLAQDWMRELRAVLDAEQNRDRLQRAYGQR